MVSQIQLRNRQGQRRYLDPEERAAFITVAKRLDPLEYTFCLTLAMTGCRISEALMLIKQRFDFNQGEVLLDTLKRRGSGIFRSVPVPEDYLETMNIAHSLRRAQKHGGARAAVERLWPWSRAHGWRVVKKAMADAGIRGPQATAKGLRHGFAVHALMKGVGLNVVQELLGHSSIETTTIYLQVIGKEKRALVSKMW